MTADEREIEFGEIEAGQHARRLRPDRNRQFCVMACGRPADDDLPIFVDLDALGDMEAHALSETRRELGGVMLGGQYEDDQGRPFVLIADSLRARHYESTASSFKFTKPGRNSPVNEPIGRATCRSPAGTIRIRIWGCSCPRWTISYASTSLVGRRMWPW